jgi:RNA polymerase sigma-70 factor (ECF subfamily)
VGGTLDPASSVARFAGAAVPAVDSDERLRTQVRANYEFLWRSLRRLGVPQAWVEDAAQQVLAVFGRRIDQVRPGAERAFLFATATRVASGFRKKKSRALEVLDSEGLDRHASAAPSAEELIDQGRARELFDRVLGEIPGDLRAVFILFELEDMTMATIAEMLDLPMGTVASRLRRAREIFEREAERWQRGGRRP